MSTVRVSYEDELALITIDRPEQSNALDSATARALRDAIQDASERVRVAIVTGSGRAFCAGGDLQELERWTDLSEEEIGSVLYAGYQGMIRAIRASPAVVIAAVNGAAVGAGMDLALACDVRLATESARFGQVWVRLGVIPGTGGAYLTQALAGPGRAAELLLTGDIISAPEALEAGLVNRVVPAAELLTEARALAARILRNPPEGVVANKRAYVAVTEAAVEAALAHAASVQPRRFTSDEFRKAVRAALSR
jgi:2-(1,2-epoxy-1,2-dihydrophenyl)acetyl-CoA isomerase